VRLYRRQDAARHLTVLEERAVWGERAGKTPRVVKDGKEDLQSFLFGNRENKRRDVKY